MFLSGEFFDLNFIAFKVIGLFSLKIFMLIFIILFPNFKKFYFILRTFHMRSTLLTSIFFNYTM